MGHLYHGYVKWPEGNWYNLLYTLVSPGTLQPGNFPKSHGFLAKEQLDVFLNLFHKHPQPKNFDMNCKWQTSWTNRDGAVALLRVVQLVQPWCEECSSVSPSYWTCWVTGKSSPLVSAGGSHSSLIEECFSRVMPAAVAWGYEDET